MVLVRSVLAFLAFSVSFVNSAPKRPYTRLASVPEKSLLEAIFNDTMNVTNGRLTERLNGADSVCYDELGCFDRRNGVFSYIGELPYSPEKMNTKFILFTSNNKDNGVTFTYTDVSPAIAQLSGQPRSLVFLVHGFNSNGEIPWARDLKNIVLDSNEAAIIVDWSNGCPFPFYAQSVVNMELVGRQIAVVLWKLIQAAPESVSPSLVHFVGHSLGAHVGRFLADYFAVLSGGLRIGRLTGLDPAGPLLENYHVYANASSANYVDMLHTSAGDDTFGILVGRLGMHSAVGHLDIFANGGTTQPGCPLLEFLTCAHSRAHDYYVSAAKLEDPKSKATNCGFRSYACEGGKQEYDNHNCRRVPGQYNAISLDGSYPLPGRGTQFVDTTGSEPFCTAPSS